MKCIGSGWGSRRVREIQDCGNILSTCGDLFYDEPEVVKASELNQQRKL